MYDYGANNPVRYIDPNGRFNAVDDTIKGFSLWFNAFSNPTDFNTLNEVSDFMNATPEFWLCALVGVIAVGEYAYCYNASEDFSETISKINNLLEPKIGFNIKKLAFVYTKEKLVLNLNINLWESSFSDDLLVVSTNSTVFISISKYVDIFVQLQITPHISLKEKNKSNFNDIELAVNFDLKL